MRLDVHRIRFRQHELVQSGLCATFRGRVAQKRLLYETLSSAPKIGAIIVSVLMMTGSSEVPILIWEIKSGEEIDVRGRGSQEPEKEMVQPRAL